MLCSRLQCHGTSIRIPAKKKTLAHGSELCVQCFGVGSSWRQPEATHIVKYSKKETGSRHLDGRVACKLAADNYGRGEWWLLLDTVAS